VVSYVDDLADAIRSVLPGHLAPDDEANPLSRLDALMRLTKGEDAGVYGLRWRYSTSSRSIAAAHADFVRGDG
jgi:hypothetical protein